MLRVRDTKAFGHSGISPNVLPAASGFNRISRESSTAA
jgi:hypothetical protein